MVQTYSFMNPRSIHKIATFFRKYVNISLLVFLISVAGMEPGLALMDEIGRRALTDAFIRFTRETAKTHRFLYNPKFDDR